MQAPGVGRPTSATDTAWERLPASISSTRAPALWRASSGLGAERTASSEDRRLVRAGPTAASSSSPSGSRRTCAASSRFVASTRRVCGARPGDPRGDRRRTRRRLRFRASLRASARNGGRAADRARRGAAASEALQAGLAYELIASRSELERIVGAARRGTASRTCGTLTDGARSWWEPTCAICSTGAARWLSGQQRRSCSANAPLRPLGLHADQDAPTSSMIDIAGAWSNIVRDSASVISRGPLDRAEVHPRRSPARRRVGHPQFVSRRVAAFC